MSADSFDLTRFAPPTGVTITLRSQQRLRFPGDPDVDDVAVMLRLEEQINDAAGVALADRLTEAKETLKRLALAADPKQDVDELKVGTEEILVIFALLVHGSTVAEAVGAAITAANESMGETREGESPEGRTAREAAEVGDPDGPLSRSESSSSERSSGSAAEEGSLRATG